MSLNRSTVIRNLEIKPGLVLAPMSGVTCSAFRTLIKELNPDSVGLVVSEFISVEGLTRESVRSRDMMRFREMERPFGIQIFGYDIQRMRDAALMVQDAGADLVDINCGCPAPKVVKRGGGCELMRQPEHLSKILHEVRKAVQIPLTLKMRSGWDETSKNSIDIARMAEAEGVESLAVHGRTRSQLYRGQADWSIVEAVADSVSIPVFGSGDVVDAKTAQERWRGKVAGLYIGRGAMENPLVFTQLAKGQAPELRHSERLVLGILLRYLELLRQDYPDKAVIGRFKQLVTQMCRGYAWRKDICRAMTLDEQMRILSAIQDGTFRSPHAGESGVGCLQNDCERSST
jgi:tRNA-dihydrouridine synthase B